MAKKLTQKIDLPKSTYKVLSPINDGDDDYVEGDEIELTEPQAAELIRCGAIAEPAPKSSSDDSKEGNQ